MDRLCAAIGCRPQHLVDVEVGFGGRTSTEAYSDVSALHVQGLRISLVVYGHRLDTEPVQSPYDTGGDGTSVGDQYSCKHVSLFR